jgi:4-alpha-glucanotransferase
MGPGMDFVRAVRRKLPGASIIVENLGGLSKEAKAFVKESGFPKMSVVQYSFYKKDNPRLSRMDGGNFIAYTGTHDADTLVGWIKKPANLSYVENAKRELGVRTKKELLDAMIREVLSAPSIFSIVQLQDYIGLGNAYRVNRPGTISKRNWSMKLKASMLTKGLARKMREMKRKTGTPIN